MKVLIADDDATSRCMLQRVLETIGYEVITARDGREALSILGEPMAPQLAILDWVMPRFSGPDICEAIRKENRDRYTYILLLSSKANKADLILGFEAGADDYITKPFDGQELRVRLRTGRRILELQSQLIAAREMFRDQALHDSLTGLLNHNAILTSAERELTRARRQATSVGLILGDLDYFKKVNDEFGHQVGDLVLQDVAKRILTTSRLYDSVGRYGGEEFLVVASNCTSADAAELAERLRRFVAQTPVTAECHSLPVTISLGVVSSDMFHEVVSTEFLLREADKALYRAKRDGRNRVAVQSRSCLKLA